MSEVEEKLIEASLSDLLSRVASMKESPADSLDMHGADIMALAAKARKLQFNALSAADPEAKILALSALQGAAELVGELPSDDARAVAEQLQEAAIMQGSDTLQQFPDLGNLERVVAQSELIIQDLDAQADLKQGDLSLTIDIAGHAESLVAAALMLSDERFGDIDTELAQRFVQADTAFTDYLHNVSMGGDVFEDTLASEDERAAYRTILDRMIYIADEEDKPSTTAADGQGYSTLDAA